ncbi:fumarate/nitrate reduction transcriptional regulator Fnr [Paraglaciecola sp. L3A3]|uniref:fumarate/nitrate reduction transcriptional regulator Fnr n=1 Tax=Paraglaciecola sp. L3A3 TaxID=2686358 RepID=UPI00131B78F9|nr:fumarate/nitrate reduction transcriptional regulator Fnr [Paraglaciecola sp. L3A3]
MQIETKNSIKQCPHNKQVSCDNCKLNTICMPVSLHFEDIDRLNNIIQRGKPLNKGEYLFRVNDPFTSVYAVRSGALKTHFVTENGAEQITGFYLPGEILGMDGLGTDLHCNSVQALETSSVCKIPFNRLEELSTKLPSLQRHFLQLMSREITQEQQMVGLLNKQNAESRIASLLLSISSRNSRRGLSGSTFILPMSRKDLGNYLGLTIETVSRIFSRLQKNELIAVEQKEVSILDIAALQKLAKGPE